MRAAKMLNSVHGRKFFLKDVCVERVVPEYIPKTVAKDENGDKESNENEEGEEDVENESVEVDEDVRIKVLIPPSMGDRVLQGFEL